MTKSEFQSKYTATYNKFILNNTKDIVDRMKQHSGNNGKLSTEELAAVILVESLAINRDFLQSVLEEVLQFDE